MTDENDNKGINCPNCEHEIDFVPTIDACKELRFSMALEVEKGRHFFADTLGQMLLSTANIYKEIGQSMQQDVRLLVAGVSMSDTEVRFDFVTAFVQEKGE